MAGYDSGWGPSHQYRPPPTRRSGWLKASVLALFGLLLLGPPLRAAVLDVLAFAAVKGKAKKAKRRSG
jgi:hypothetical protein